MKLTQVLNSYVHNGNTNLITKTKLINMKKLLLICLVAGLMAGCKKESLPEVSTAASSSEVSVTITGGYETVASDGGRPTILIASALGIPQTTFQLAFSGVTPAKGGQPTTSEELANKAALLRVLSPLGITNDRLDEVSDYYRYLESSGQVWTRVAAEATATVVNGTVTKITITKAGSGYSSVPVITVVGSTSKLSAAISYSTDFTTNGRISAINIQ
jgi:hypothetical protein